MHKANYSPKKIVVVAGDILVTVASTILFYRLGYYLASNFGVLHAIEINWNENKTVVLAFEIIVLVIFAVLFFKVMFRDEKLRDAVLGNISLANIKEFLINSFLAGLTGGLCLTVFMIIFFTFLQNV